MSDQSLLSGESRLKYRRLAKTPCKSRAPHDHSFPAGHSLMLLSSKIQPQAKRNEVRMRFMANDNVTRLWTHNRCGISESAALCLTFFGRHR